MSDSELTGECERRGCHRPAAVKVVDTQEELWFGACRDCAQRSIAEYDALEVDGDE
jgi:hypothetical protein